MVAILLSTNVTKKLDNLSDDQVIIFCGISLQQNFLQELLGREDVRNMCQWLIFIVGITHDYSIYFYVAIRLYTGFVYFMYI